MQFGEHARRPCREQKQPVGHANRIIEIVRDEQRGDAPAVDQHGELVAQSRRHGGIERNERLIQQKQLGLDRKRARERNPARQPERELARVVEAVRRELEGLKQSRELLLRKIRCHQSHVVLDRAPRQQPWFLEHHGELAALRRTKRSGEIRIETGNDAQHGGLAAARRANQNPDLADRHSQCDVAEHLEDLAARGPIGFMRNANVKQFGAANVTRVVQWVAPPMFRSPGSRRRRPAHRQECG